MYKTQKGFTLVELVVVIVLLGILGVTALGKFEDLSTDAQTAANSGVAAELSSAAAINYAASLLPTATSVVVGTTEDSCLETDIDVLFQSGVFPAGMTSGNPTPVGACGAAGTTFTCDITADSGLGTLGIATLICTQ
ncbi:MAG: prepilin-type N-terminal cleavage/methylation domain-containing protein [bacterium]|nr:prepilin-type N-terminal cleavage/methylation domain-containing protein [bacterium]